MKKNFTFGSIMKATDEFVCTVLLPVLQTIQTSGTNGADPLPLPLPPLNRVTVCQLIRSQD